MEMQVVHGGACRRADWGDPVAGHAGTTPRDDENGDKTMTELDEATRTELEAAAFRRLVSHLRNRADVQNLDLMNLAGFCRNCLSNWLKDAADERGLDLSKETMRTHVYGMPYDEWKARHQTEARPEQLAAFEAAKPQH
jgi:hypothetical protein